MSSQTVARQGGEEKWGRWATGRRRARQRRAFAHAVSGQTCGSPASSAHWRSRISSSGSFAVAPDWTTEYLLTVVDAEADDSDAIWDGILWAARPPSRTLYE